MSVVLGIAASLFAAGQALAQPPVKHCGQSLDKSGTYFLANDLDCSGTLASGIDINASNVVFHLAGHRITSTDCDLTKDINGISVHGGLSDVHIEGGTVRGFNDGIVLGSSDSRVTAMTVTGACLFGVAVQGTNNQLDRNVVTQSGLDGFGIGPGGGNRIVLNDVSSNARVGVEISNFSNKNRVANNNINNNGLVDHEQGGVAIFNGTGNIIANNALSNNFEGIEIESPGNLVQGNRVSASVDTGIFITNGSPSTVRDNIVFGSGLVDMLDNLANCGPDKWMGNNFRTDLVADVPDGGPTRGCLR